MIRVFTAFSGYDSQLLALDMLHEAYPEFTYRCVGWSEIDKNAIQAHNALYPELKDLNYGDISKIDWNKVEDMDLFTYSWPCGLKGTLIKTDNGYKDISEVKVGDNVLTQKNRYMPVIKTMTRKSPSYYKIAAVGCKLKLTSEHPLWVLRDGEQMWVKVKDLKKTDKLSYCIPQGNEETQPDDVMWLLGRYVADGWINKFAYNSVFFAIGKPKEKEFLQNIPHELIPRFRRYEKDAYEYRIADPFIKALCDQFGHGAQNKFIPEWLFRANTDSIKAFLRGYFAGDGYHRKNHGQDVWMFSTVSKQLFLGLQMLIMKCYGKAATVSIREDNRSENYSTLYSGQFCAGDPKQQVKIDDKMFTCIKSIELVEDEVDVFNFSVQEDESYTCDNVITHNCTDISNAGLQAGFEKGSGTRSSLLWECEEAIRVKRPKWLLMENVKALVGKKNLPLFNKWLNLLSSYGYRNFTKVINATQFGVPQNRERVFCISILGDDEYHFPKEIGCDIVCNDILLDGVDPSFFIKGDKMLQVVSDCYEKENSSVDKP